MKEERKYFAPEFKLGIIREVLDGALSKEGARRKYGLKGKSPVLQWMRKFGLSTQTGLPPQALPMPKDPFTDRTALLKRIMELERALEDAQLRAEGYRKMIELAEQQLKVPIKKKWFTKQSEK
jgi:transposase-like protein